MSIVISPTRLLYRSTPQRVQRREMRSVHIEAADSARYHAPFPNGLAEGPAYARGGLMLPPADSSFHIARGLAMLHWVLIEKGQKIDKKLTGPEIWEALGERKFFTYRNGCCHPNGVDRNQAIIAARQAGYIEVTDHPTETYQVFKKSPIKGNPPIPTGRYNPVQCFSLTESGIELLTKVVQLPLPIEPKD